VVDRHRHDGAVFIAHAAHWISTLAYFAPVVCIAVWLIATQQRERRRARSGGGIPFAARDRNADCTNAQPDSAPSAVP
jgi:hypothetical protein